jgi:hypothetical protein
MGVALILLILDLSDVRQTSNVNLTTNVKLVFTGMDL